MRTAVTNAFLVRQRCVLLVLRIRQQSAVAWAIITRNLAHGNSTIMGQGHRPSRMG